MIQPNTMGQIIKSQQEQISSLLTTNCFLVESNEKLLKQADTLQHKIQELLLAGSLVEPSAVWTEK